MEKNKNWCNSIIPKFKNKHQVSAEIDVNTDIEVAKEIIDVERTSSKMGKLISIILIIVGTILIILGINGTVDLQIKVEYFSAKILNCTPGVLCLILGVIIIFITNPKIKTINKNNS